MSDNDGPYPLPNRHHQILPTIAAALLSNPLAGVNTISLWITGDFLVITRNISRLRGHTFIITIPPSAVQKGLTSKNWDRILCRIITACPRFSA